MDLLAGWLAVWLAGEVSQLAQEEDFGARKEEKETWVGMVMVVAANTGLQASPIGG